MSGRCYRVEAPRSQEMNQWLRCNDIDPGVVPFKADVFVESVDGEKWLIRHEVYLRLADGFLAYDARTREYTCVEQFAPLVNDPPMWWLSETAPTGGGAVSAGPVGAETATGCEHTVAEGARHCD